MIYLLSREGQMCNQLLSMAAVCALGVEYGCDVRCPVIDKNLKNWFLFSEDVKDINIKTYFSPIWNALRMLHKLVNKIFRIEYHEKFNPRNTGKNQYFYSRISFFEPEVFIKHIEEIRLFLDFRPEIKRQCASLINKYKKEDTVLIGVHIRRGDYKEFYEGKWYYTDEEYAHWMKSLAINRRVCFILCSNEKISLKKYRQQGLHAYMASGTAIEDLCTLSMCDYVMGPPSTYSLWAAMIGGKRRWILDQRTQEIEWGEAKLLEERVLMGEKVC